MKNLKKFNTYEQYKTYIEGSDALLPNVSICNDNVYYKSQLPNNEIWYTSSNNDVAYPENKRGVEMTIGDGFIEFGAKIVSNTYENNKGILKFDRPLVRMHFTRFYWPFDTISFPDSISSIEGLGLEVWMHGVHIPNNAKHIGDNCFSELPGITSINIPDKLLTLNFEVFRGCYSLTSVRIPDSVTTIETRAFGGCTSLESIHIPAAVSLIEGNPCGSEMGDNSALSTITVDPNNLFYNSEDDCNAIIETSTNKLICGCKNTTIPYSVTSIGSEAFVNMPVSLSIPESVSAIAHDAFGNDWHSQSIYCYPTTPPTIDRYDLMIGDNCTVYVPSFVLEDYKTAQGWTWLAEQGKIQPMD